jgi:hypothetical protein
MRRTQLFGKTAILVNTAGFVRLFKHDDVNALADELIGDITTMNWFAQFGRNSGGSNPAGRISRSCGVSGESHSLDFRTM